MVRVSAEANLKDVGPHEIQQVQQRILVAETDHTQRHVLDSGAGSLPMHNVAVHQRVLQQRRNSIDVVLAHFSAHHKIQLMTAAPMQNQQTQCIRRGMKATSAHHSVHSARVRDIRSSGRAALKVHQ